VRVSAALALKGLGDESGLDVLLKEAEAGRPAEALKAIWGLASFPRNERTIESLLRLLESPDVQRLRAATRLALKCPDPRVRQALVALLSRNDLVPGDALEALSVIGDEGCLGPVLDLMEQGRGAGGARLALVGIGSRKAVERLIALLGSPTEWVRRDAGQALRSLTCQVFSHARPELWKAWWTEHRDQYLASPNLPYPELTKEDEKRAWELARLLVGEKTQAEARAGLLRLGPAVIPTLRKKLFDRNNWLEPAWDSTTYEAALGVIAQMGKPGIAELTRLSVADDPGGFVPRRAWEMLVRLDRKAAADFVLYHLEVGERDYMAVHKLKECAYPAQAPAIRKLVLNPPDSSAKAELLGILVKLEGDKASDFIAEAGREKSGAPSLDALRALGQTDPKKMALLFESSCAAMNPYDVSFRAMELAARWPKEMVPALERLRDGKLPERTRVQAAVALCRLRRPGAVEALGVFLKSDDRLVRCEAARWLEEVGGEPVLAELLRVAAEDPDSSCRAAAATALGTTGKREALPTLVKLLGDPGESVPRAALRALDRITGLGYLGRDDGKEQVAQAIARYKAWWENEQKAPSQRKDLWQEGFWAELDKAAKGAKPPVAADLAPQLLVPYARETALGAAAMLMPGLCLVAFAPCGDRLAFVHQASEQAAPDIVCMDIKTRKAKKHLNGVYPFSMAFSPDGESLAVAAVAVKPPMELAPCSLSIVSLPTGAARPLMQMKEPFALEGEPGKLSLVTSCLWPDKETLAAYVVRSGVPRIELVRVADGSSTVLFDCAAAEKTWPPLKGMEGLVSERWTPLGEKLSATDSGDLYFAWKGRIFCVNARTKRAELVADCLLEGGYSNPRVTPSGRRFLFQGGEEREACFLVFDPDLSNGRLVARLPAGSPLLSEDWAAWFPKGEHLAVATGQAIVLAKADGVRQVSVSMAEGSACASLWPLGDDSLAILSQGGIWRLNVARQLRALDAMRDPKAKLRYPDFSTPEATAETYEEAMRRGDLQTVARCVLPEARAAYDAFLKKGAADRELRALKQAIVVEEVHFARGERRLETTGDEATILWNEKPLYRLAKRANEWKLAPPKEK
jgi:HEAT repeat protein